MTYYKGSTGYAYFEYDRAAGGRIDQLYRKDLQRVILYEYDLNDRLLRETWKNSTGRGNVGSTTYYDFQYAYDLAGNRTAQYSSVDADSTYFHYADDNSLTVSWRNTAGYETYFAYDANGSCTAIFTPNGTTFFDYNAANLVTHVTVQDAAANPTVAYDYDANFNRYKHTAAGTAYYQYWDQGQLMQIRAGASSQLYTELAYGPSCADVPGIGEAVIAYAVFRGFYFFVMDHRGSVIKLQSNTGGVAATREYNGFGEVIAETGTWPDEVPFAYQSNWQRVPFQRPTAGGTALGGHLWLTPAGLYDAETGRFLYRDPIGSKRDPIGRGGLNLYTYCNNNPVNNVDPEGKFVILGIVAALGALAVLAYMYSVYHRLASMPSVTPRKLSSCTSVPSALLSGYKSDIETPEWDCPLIVKAFCKNTGTQSPFAHCWLSIWDKNTGVEQGTISAFRSEQPNYGKLEYLPDNDLGKYSVPSEEAYEIGFSTLAQNDCEFINCATTYADQLNLQFEYDAPSLNSSSFLQFIVSRCGGSITFPRLAFGGTSVRERPW